MRLTCVEHVGCKGDDAAAVTATQHQHARCHVLPAQHNTAVPPSRPGTRPYRRQQRLMPSSIALKTSINKPTCGVQRQTATTRSVDLPASFAHQTSAALRASKIELYCVASILLA